MQWRTTKIITVIGGYTGQVQKVLHAINNTVASQDAEGCAAIFSVDSVDQPITVTSQQQVTNNLALLKTQCLTVQAMTVSGHQLTWLQGREPGNLPAIQPGGNG